MHGDLGQHGIGQQFGGSIIDTIGITGGSAHGRHGTSIGGGQYNCGLWHGVIGVTIHGGETPQGSNRVNWLSHMFYN